VQKGGGEVSGDDLGKTTVVYAPGVGISCHFKKRRGDKTKKRGKQTRVNADLWERGRKKRLRSYAEALLTGEKGWRRKKLEKRAGAF